MQVKEYLKVHQLHLRKCMWNTNHLQGILNVFKCCFAYSSHRAIPLPHCICLYSSAGWCLLCLIGHRILYPLPQWPGKSWQQHMALTSLHHRDNSTFLEIGELQTLAQQPELKYFLPFPTGMDTCLSRDRAERAASPSHCRR